MKKKTIYYFDLYGGTCGLGTSREEILQENGSRNVKLIRKATAFDVAWVSSMGGYVPENTVMPK